jgi:hypothetical protein
VVETTMDASEWWRKRFEEASADLLVMVQTSPRR